MASKSNNTLIILCLSLALVLLISAQAAATDLADDTTSKGPEETNGVADAKYPGGGYGGGGPGGGYNNGGRGGYGGGRCRYGCCRRSYNGCRRCCSYAGEAVETTKP